MAYRTYANTNGFIVAQDGTADFTTIAAAIAAINTKGLTTSIIYLTLPSTGAYTETITLPAGCTLTTMGGGEDVPAVLFNGTITYSATGTAKIYGIQLASNGAYGVILSGGNACNLMMDNCYINCLTNTFFSLTNSNSSTLLSIQNTNGNIATTGITYFDGSTFGGRFNINYATLGNSGSSTTQSVISGTFNSIQNSSLSFPIVTTSTQFNETFVTHTTYGLNVTPLTVNAGVAPLFQVSLGGGNSPSLTLNGGGAIVSDLAVNSTSTYAISGATGFTLTSVLGTTIGKIQNTIINSNPMVIGTLNLSVPLSSNFGGTGLTSIANGALLYGSGGSALTVLPIGTNGDILQLKSGVPAWSTPAFPITVGASGTIITSNGSNFVSTTATYPATTTINQLLYSSAANTITGLATATTAVLTTSSGVPTWASSLSVALGGTGNTSTTAYALICGGTSTTGAFQAVADVATGQVLTSGGTSALPAFSAYPQISGLGIGSSPGSTAGLTFDGSNFINAYSSSTSSFTPTIFGASTAGTTTYVTQTGNYVRIGRLVYISCYISWSAATGTGIITIGGLPFTVNNTTSFNTLSTYGTVAVATSTSLLALAEIATTTIVIYGLISASGSIISSSLAANQDNYIYVNGCYLT